MHSSNKKLPSWAADIDAEGVHISDSKAKKIREWPAPMNRKDLSLFLGFMQFIAKSIKDYAKIAKPLTELGKEKNPWKWTEADAEAFKALKDAVEDAPSLHIIDPEDANARFEVYTDGSGYALGAILYQ